MENDVLKNKIAPWQEKGRWYHLKVTSDGSVWAINHNESDAIFANSVISASSVIVNEPDLNAGKAFIVDIKANLHNLAATSSGFNIPHGAFFKYLSNTRQYIVLVAASSYIGDVDIYAFISK